MTIHLFLLIEIQMKKKIILKIKIIHLIAHIIIN